MNATLIKNKTEEAVTPEKEHFTAAELATLMGSDEYKVTVLPAITKDEIPEAEEILVKRVKHTPTTPVIRMPIGLL